MTTAVSSDHPVPVIPYATPAFAPAPAGRKPRVVFLDVIRGLAALSVLIQHTTEETTHIGTHEPFLFWTFRWFNFGRLGVAAFFLVSGFVIPYSLERANSLKHFWVSRLFRLYPLYWFSLLLVVLFHLAGNHEMSIKYDDYWRKVVVYNITMVQEFIGKPNAIGLYWTLTLEMVFYVLFSALFLFGINKKTLLWAWLGLGAMLACGVGQVVLQQINLHHVFHRTLPEKLPTGRVALLSFAFLGTAAFRYYAGIITRKQLSLLAIGAAVVFAISFGLGFRGPLVTSDASEEWSAMSMFGSYAAAAVLFSIIFMHRAGDFPFVLRWLGTISYSVYLLHYPVWLTLMRIPHHGLVSGPLWQLMVLAITCSAASLTYLFVEKPAIELGKKLLGKPKPATELGHPIVVQTPTGLSRVVTDG